MPGRLPMIAADVRDVETGDGTEHHRVALSGGQFGDALQRGLGVEAAHRGVAGVDALRGDRCAAERRGIDRHRRPARLAPEVVDRAAAGDGEEPRPERGLVAVEAGDRGCDRGPGLRRDVLGGIAGGHAQVAEQRRLVLVPEGGERRRVAVACPSNTVGKDVPIIVPP